MNNRRRTAWTGFIVHFAFGAFVGAAIGFGAWAQSSAAPIRSLDAGYLYIGGGAILLGLIFGIAGERFWETFRWW